MSTRCTERQWEKFNGTGWDERRCVSPRSWQPSLNSIYFLINNNDVGIAIDALYYVAFFSPSRSLSLSLSLGLTWNGLTGQLKIVQSILCVGFRVYYIDFVENPFISVMCRPLFSTLAREEKKTSRMERKKCQRYTGADNNTKPKQDHIISLSKHICMQLD